MSVFALRTSAPTRVALVVALALGLAACGPQDDEDLSATLAERDAEIERLDAEVAELEAEIERLRDEGPAPREPDPDERPANPRTAEGLVEQLHTYFWPDPELELGFDPGPTPWEDAEVPPGFGDADAAFPTPGELMTALAADLAGAQLGGDAWEVATRVLLDAPQAEGDADAATGAVLLWGFLDDAVAGSDHRFALRRGADGWYAVSAEQRSRCARGVTDEGLCV